jgi:class I fructose-bisphosphate aldolase
LLLLAADQGLERGPLAFAADPDGGHPEQALRLAVEGGFSGIIVNVGHAERYLGGDAGYIPFILKLNGKTDVPPDDEALAPLTASVEDAVRLGADGVLYTLYLGSPAQFEDLTQLAGVRRECMILGMPLLLHAMPGGGAVERRGGAASQYMLEYGARVADELGVDLVILGLPQAGGQHAAQVPKLYSSLHVEPEAAIQRLVRCANSTPVVIDLGAAEEPQGSVAAEQAIAAGACGLLVRDGGAQRPVTDAVARIQRLAGLLTQQAEERRPACE